MFCSGLTRKLDLSLYFIYFIYFIYPNLVVSFCSSCVNVTTQLKENFFGRNVKQLVKNEINSKIEKHANTPFIRSINHHENLAACWTGITWAEFHVFRANLFQYFAVRKKKWHWPNPLCENVQKVSRILTWKGLESWGSCWESWQRSWSNKHACVSSKKEIHNLNQIKEFN